ncbi:MAG: GspE/PulE family protein, partial [Fusobacteriota bacterium]
MVKVRKKMKLGTKLLKNGLITEDQLKEGLDIQRKTKEKLGEVFTRLGFVKIDDILPVLADDIGVQSLRIDNEELSIDLLDIISEDVMRKYEVLPIEKRGNKLTVAMANPEDLVAIDELQMHSKMVIKPVLAMKKEIEEAIDYIHRLRDEQENEKIDEILDELDKENGDEPELVEDTGIEDLRAGMNSDSAPIVRTVNAIVAGAIKAGASDIHIEPYEKVLRIRYRIDGVLSEVKKFPKRVAGAVISRVKIMSDLDIAEKRLPQDGRFRIKLNGHKIDFRVSCLPTVQGEKIVLRILDKKSLELSMEDLGFEEEELEKFQKALSSSYGMILVTGPTGSGKSTTLYSAMNKLKSPSINLSTAEDPVEFQINGINQVHCKPEIGLDFPSALKSFLRQDPDIIMVGEIRDEETAAISIKAALTGHLLLSTLHTNSAPGTVQRLLNIGVKPFMLASSLILIEAQRLGRRICKHCKEEETGIEDKKKIVGIDSSTKVYHGKGCPKCNGTGYKGRVGFYEVMFVDDELRDLISRAASTEEIKKVAMKNGMKTIRQQAVIKVEKGVTT